MRFLIRDILVITFFIAIATFYFSAQRNFALLSARLATVEKQNAAAHLEYARLDAQRDFVQADVDRARQIEDLTKQIESHFPALQAKYSAIEPRDATTVSVRQIPMWIDRQTGSDLSRIRVQVPTERSVFLKYGIAMQMSQPKKQWKANRLGDKFLVEGQAGLQSVLPRELHLFYFEDGIAARQTSQIDAAEDEGNRSDRGSGWQSISDYSSSGPFEYRLPIGTLDIDWSTNLNQQGQWEVQLLVNQQSLLTAELQVKASCNGYTSLWAESQLDFTAGDRLPELFSSRSVPVPFTNTSRDNKFEIQVWLDEHSSGFREFPDK